MPSASSSINKQVCNFRKFGFVCFLYDSWFIGLSISAEFKGRDTLSHLLSDILLTWAANDVVDDFTDADGFFEKFFDFLVTDSLWEFLTEAPRF